MTDKLSVYDFLAFVLPGLVVIVVGFYGFYGWPYQEPGASYLVGIVAAGFLAGHALAAVASLAMPLAFGRAPWHPVPSSWGLRHSRRLGAPSEGELLRWLGAHRDHGGDDVLETALTDARTKYRGHEHLRVVNSQIGFYRNAAAATATSAVLVVVYAVIGRRHLHVFVWTPLLLATTVLFSWRLRRFWLRFGEELVALPRLEQPIQTPVQLRSDSPVSDARRPR